MMYSNNFVVVIKYNGKVLRENDSVVRLPFGSDYSILLKNKDSRKAVANVEIDGEDVATGIIIPGNDSVELKGAIEGLRVNNKFRFIQKTREISDYRGDRPDDGLVRVEYRFEQYEPEVLPIRPLKEKSDPWQDITKTVWYYTDNGSTSGNTMDCCYYTASYNNFNDEGITVPGAETRQDFMYGYTKPLESQSFVIILHLRGRTKEHKVIRKPITVKTILKCSTCGRKSKSSAKFCKNCGTYLK